jgi:DNA polymerase IIIc chi subunit
MADNNNIIDDEEATELSLLEIFRQVEQSDTQELIVTIPEEQADALRKGLASVKAKQNQKLKNSGISPDGASLHFTVYPHKDEKTAKEVVGIVDIHIKLGKRSTIQVLGVRKPDPSI